MNTQKKKKHLANVCLDAHVSFFRKPKITSITYPLDSFINSKQSFKIGPKFNKAKGRNLEAFPQSIELKYIFVLGDIFHT